MVSTVSIEKMMRFAEQHGFTTEEIPGRSGVTAWVLVKKRFKNYTEAYMFMKRAVES